MNAVLAQPAPLPQALSRRSDSARRRHRIGHHALDPGVLRHFNELIARIDLQRAPLDRDQLASAARELIDDPAQGFAPACIHQRMRRAAAIDRMRADRRSRLKPLLQRRDAAQLTRNLALGLAAR